MRVVEISRKPPAGDRQENIRQELVSDTSQALEIEWLKKRGAKYVEPTDFGYWVVTNAFKEPLARLYW